MDADHEIDARGLLCPLPVLRARKRLMSMPTGSVLRVLTTDPAAIVDLPHFCSQKGHLLLSMETGSDGQRFLIQRGPDA